MHLASTESGETMLSVLAHHSAVGVTKSVGRIPPRPAGPGAATERGTAKSGKPRVGCPPALARYPRRRLGPQSWASRGPERRLMLRPA